MKKLFLFSLVLLIGACKKYVPGPQGDPGANGHNGNSNISSTVAFVAKSKTWDSLVVNDKWWWEKNIAVAEISKSVLSKGDVMVYKQISGEWQPLPVFEGYLCTQAVITEGQVKLQLTHMHGAIPVRPSDETFRVVVLAPKQ